MDTPDNIKLRSTLVTALEADEWAFREAVKLLFLFLTYLSLIKLKIGL